MHVFATEVFSQGCPSEGKENEYLFENLPEKSPVSLFESGPAPGKPQNVSKNDTEVKKAVLTAVYFFNNKSNDAFFFKASAIDDAQKQVRPPVYLFQVFMCEINHNMLLLFFFYHHHHRLLKV